MKAAMAGIHAQPVFARRLRRAASLRRYQGEEIGRAEPSCEACWAIQNQITNRYIIERTI
jgi:hypothetical protein